MNTPTAAHRIEAELPATGPADEGELERRLECHMLTLVSGERFERLGAIVHEHLFTGAPKPRGSLALAATAALGLDEERQVGWAAACALLHSAGLIHDDIQDRSRYRRGGYSVWVRHGSAQAINAGDLLLMLPTLAIDGLDVDAELRWALSLATSRRAVETVRGQSLEMCLMSSRRRDWSSYIEAVEMKTSAMFALPVHGAGLLAGWSEERAERIATRFQRIGLMRQLAGELIDLYGRRKPLYGAYVREGRISGLVVEHIARDPKGLDTLGPILAKAPEDTRDEDVAAFAEHVDASGSRSAVIDRIERLCTEVHEDDVLAEEPALAAVAHSMASAVVTSVDASSR